MKRIIKSLLFIIILIFIYNYVFKILWLEGNSITYFYDEPKETMDIIYIGGSNVYNHFNTLLAYDLYGYTTGYLSSNFQPFQATQYLIEESRKYQNPKLYVIDLANVGVDCSLFTGEKYRVTTDAMKFSANRIKLVNDLLSYQESSRKDYFNFYFSQFLYHNHWKNIEEKNFIGYKNYYKGYYFTDERLSSSAQENYIWENNNIIDLPARNKESLLNLIDYIKNNNINVLFVCPKRYFNDEEVGTMNTAIKIINQNGLDFINFNTLEDFSLDFNNDYLDAKHINAYGAIKYTLYFSRYLKENYDLPNHLNDSLYSSWNEEYKRFKEDFRTATGKEYEELVNEYNYF